MWCTNLDFDADLKYAGYVQTKFVFYLLLPNIGHVLSLHCGVIVDHLTITEIHVFIINKSLKHNKYYVVVKI